MSLCLSETLLERFLCVRKRTYLALILVVKVTKRGGRDGVKTRRREDVKEQPLFIANITQSETCSSEFPYALPYHLALENGEERKLDSTLAYAMQALKVAAESDLQVWLLLARVLSWMQRLTRQGSGNKGSCYV